MDDACFNILENIFPLKDLDMWNLVLHKMIFSVTYNMIILREDENFAKLSPFGSFFGPFGCPKFSVI